MAIRFPIYIIWGMIVCLFALPSFAADDLYAAPPPPGSAFVRVINGDAAASAVVSIRGKRLSAVAPGQIGEYGIVPEGEGDIALGAKKTSGRFQAGRYYSTVVKSGTLTILEDPFFKNKLKAQLILVNLSDVKTISLKTPDGKVGIVESVAVGASAAREVNTIKSGFSVYADAEKLADIASRPLERGASYAIVAYTGKGGKVAISYDKAAVQ
jgi:hypothetical protein